jgi:tRNA pseudouridine55 synthase
MANNEEKCGFLLINKPSGPTSHDVIAKLRHLTGIRKIGHAGTLDPLASGLLICAVGRQATKQIDKFVKQNKTYEAEGTLGAVSDTYDSQGIITAVSQEKIGQEELIKSLNKFVGTQDQTPPMYSAKKVAGKKLYELARQGIEIERKACCITISRLELTAFEYPKFKIIIDCSTGTYVRSLIYDIGQDLRVGSFMSALKRTTIGNFNLSQATELSSLTPENWIDFLLTTEI